MINTLKRATKLAPWLSVAAILATAAPAFAQAPSQAQRDAIKSAVPLGLYGALLQRAAGRRGIAAMPAEEHVEPLVELPERGARRGSAGGCDRPPSRPRLRRRKPLHPRLQRPQRPKLPNQRLQQPPQRDSRAAPRFPRSAAPAAPIIQRSARACRPAARRRCNAWKRTRRNSRPVARKPSPPPAAVAQRPRQVRLRPRRERLLPRHQRRLRP